MRLDHLLSRESDERSSWSRCFGQVKVSFSYCSILRALQKETSGKTKKRHPIAMAWGYSSVGRAPALQAGGQGFESLYLHHQQHAAFCGCLWACIVLLLIRSTVICAELLNYDHEDECLVRAAWTSDLHRASSSRKNAVPSGETGCGIGEAHTLVSHLRE